MNEAPWWRHLRGDPSRSLLDEREPGLVWTTLAELLGRPLDSPAVLRAREAARTAGAAAAILARQDRQGYWGTPFAYASRWHGSAWELVALAALGADPADPRVARGGEVLLHVLQPAAGGFSAGRHRPPASCFTAEVCGALVRFGFAHHPRVREAISWLIDRQGGDGGWNCPELRHLSGGGCPVAAVASLRLVSQSSPAEQRQLAGLARGAAGWLTGRRLLLGEPSPHGWLDFQHPCLGRADLLEAMYALARAGAGPDAEHGAALAVVLTRQEEGGMWHQRHATGHGEERELGSRWLTFKALIALAAYGEVVDAAGGRG